jgi:cation diffusion facilitator CzcD-associated flavoprotein CzcO
MNAQRHRRIAIVGTGFSGLGMAIRLKQRGIDDFVIFEKHEDVGGTWWANSYPGCQCDVPSHLYSFSFALNPNWSRTYSRQSEILDYLRDCAHRFDILPHVRFGHTVESASWNEDAQRWDIATSQGSWTADVCVAAHGGLAEPSMPPIDGIEDFEGQVFHSADWDHAAELKDKRVAVIGTGASGIQIVPNIQPEVKSLTVFQRTPGWIFRHTDRPIRDWERRLYRRVPFVQKLVRWMIYSIRELLVVALAKRPALADGLRRVARAHLYKQVKDPELRRKLKPRYSPGCKRMLLSNDYYPALQQPNVELVTSPIERAKTSSLFLADGREIEVDAIVCATGFHVTDNPMAERVRGRHGASLAETWESSGLRAYLGTTVPGFPNLFLMTGPNTGTGHTSLLVMIEAQINYVLDCLRYMEDAGAKTVDVRDRMTEKFDSDVQAKMTTTVWTMGGCASWYLDKTGRNTTLWPDFTWQFARMTRKFDPGAYVVGR